MSARGSCAALALAALLCLAWGDAATALEVEGQVVGGEAGGEIAAGAQGLGGRRMLKSTLSRGHSGGVKAAAKMYKAEAGQIERAGAERLPEHTIPTKLSLSMEKLKTKAKGREAVVLNAAYSGHKFANPADLLKDKLNNLANAGTPANRKGKFVMVDRPQGQVGRPSPASEGMLAAAKKANQTMWYVDNNPGPKGPKVPDKVGPITFVAFFVGDNYDDKALKRVRMCFQSAKMYHPKAKIVLMTDSTTDLSIMEELGPHVKVHRVVADHAFGEKDHLMLHRMQAELQYLEMLQAATAHDTTTVHGDLPHLVFMDTDVFFLRPLEVLNKGGFAIALTVDPSNAKHPIEMGMRMVHKAHVHRAQTFWRAATGAMIAAGKGVGFEGDRDAVMKTVAQYATPPFDTKATAFTKSLKSHKPFKIKVVLTRQMIDVMFLPCAGYNAVPSKSAKGCKPDSSSTVLHFKGGLKEGMSYYWDYVKAERSGSDVVMDSFRRKWSHEIDPKKKKSSHKKKSHG